MDRQAFARRKPLLKIFRVQDHRLAIMKFPHDAIRLARKRRERLFPFLCFRISPFCPDSRYHEELAIENFDLVFRFGPFLESFHSKNDEAGTIHRFVANLSFQKFAVAIPSDLTLKRSFFGSLNPTA
jgi:hypothetical protein